MKPLSFFTVCTIVVLFLFPFFPITANSAEEDKTQLKLDVKEFGLKNGLRVLVVERPQIPIVSCFLIFKVGSVDEPTGQSGISHLVEHMLFKGTERSGTSDPVAEKRLLDEMDTFMEQKENGFADPQLKGKIAELEQRLAPLRRYESVMDVYMRFGGANMNGATTDDSTFYYADMPSNGLDLWLMMEADRFTNPVFREFYTERSVVQEERRLRHSNPMGIFMESLKALVFQAHPYRNPTSGWDSDLGKITRADAMEYFKKNYTPNNATMVLVGDITKEKAEQLVGKYFDAWKRGPEKTEVRTVEPPQKGEKRLHLTQQFSPLITIAYHGVSAQDPDGLPLEMLMNILTAGGSSRLEKKMVTDQRLVRNISAYNRGGRYPGTCNFTAVPQDGRTFEEVEKAIYEELEKLKNTPVSPAELNKVKKQMLIGYIRSLQSNHGVASTLGHCSITDKWQKITERPDKIQAVTAEDIMRVAKKYFTKDNRTVVTMAEETEKK